MAEHSAYEPDEEEDADDPVEPNPPREVLEAVLPPLVEEDDDDEVRLLDVPPRLELLLLLGQLTIRPVSGSRQRFIV